MKLLKVTMTVFMLLTASSLLAQTVEDITEDFVSFIDRHFVGQKAVSSKTWDNTTAGIGTKTKAQGAATITNMLDYDGEVTHVLVPSVGVNLIKSDIVINFEYDGSTMARNYVYPGGVPADYAWGWQQPRGKIKIKFYSDAGTGYRVEIEYHVYPGHDDRPNSVVKKAAMAHKGTIARTVKNFLVGKGIPADVTVF